MDTIPREQKHENYTVQHIGPLESLAERSCEGRTGTFFGKYFLAKELGLTGCEVSLNRMPAGKGTPFVHAHKKNEELYIVLRGKGTFFIDGEEFPIQEGSLMRVAPDGARAWKSG